MYVVMSKLKDRISTDNKHMIKYIMRKIVLSLFALCCFSAVMAGQRIFPVGMMGKALTHIRHIE